MNKKIEICFFPPRNFAFLERTCGMRSQAKTCTSIFIKRNYFGEDESSQKEKRYLLFMARFLNAQLHAERLRTIFSGRNYCKGRKWSGWSGCLIVSYTGGAASHMAMKYLRKSRIVAKESSTKKRTFVPSSNTIACLEP